MPKSIYLLIGFVAVAACCPLTASALTEITLRDRVAMKRSVVRLADVAQIASDNEELAKQYAAMPLIAAPGAGGERFLRKREIEDLLVAHGANLSDVRIQGAAQVVVSNTSEEPAGGAPLNRHAAVLAGRSYEHAPLKLDSNEAEELRQDVERLIAVYLSTKSADAAGCKVFCDIAERHLAALHSCKSSPICSGGNAPWTGRQRLMISFTTAQGETRLPVYAEVTPKAAPVVVAIEAIPNGAVITAAHIELRTIERSPRANDRRMPVESVEKLIGMEARQAITAGAVVFSDQVQSPVIVRRGELITISTEGHGIRVRTTARALQDRSKGQLVQVESLDTKEHFDARVTGPKTAAIMTASSPSIGQASNTIETARR